MQKENRSEIKKNFLKIGKNLHKKRKKLSRIVGNCMKILYKWVNRANNQSKIAKKLLKIIEKSIKFFNKNG